MFRDFVSFEEGNDIALENNLALAKVLDIDEDIAMEGAKEFFEKQKERLVKVAKMVRDFIIKVTQKIKVFFMKVAKVDYYTIDRNDYKMAMDAKKLVSKVWPSTKVKIALIRSQKDFNKQDSLNRDYGSEGIEKAADELVANTVKANELKAAIGTGTKSGVLLNYKSSSLTSMQGSANDNLKKLTESQKIIEKAANEITDGITADVKTINATLKLVRAQIGALECQISLATKILGVSTRPNPKDKVSAKADGKAKK